jgi:hypothetical protein
VIHDVCLVHHIPLPKRDELLQLIGEQLAADIQSVRQQESVESIVFFFLKKTII